MSSGNPVSSDLRVAVLIDRCTLCEGIYLDAGELDQIFLNKTAEQSRGLMRKILRIGGPSAG